MRFKNFAEILYKIKRVRLNYNLKQLKVYKIFHTIGNNIVFVVNNNKRIYICNKLLP